LPAGKINSQQAAESLGLQLANDGTEGVPGIDTAEVINLGATDLIRKPFEFDELLPKIKAALK
jgi:hypothetical protein